VASGRIAGTSGKTSIDLGRSGAGDYYVRVGALSNKQGVGLRAVRSAVQRVTLADPSPAQTVAPRLAKAPVERPAAKLKPAPAPKDGEPSDPPKAPEPTASPKTSEPTRSAGTLGVALRTPGAIRPLGLGSCMAEVSFRWDVTSLLPQAARVRWELKRDSDFQNRTGPEPGRLASEVGTPSGFVTLDLREFGPVMNGTPYYFRLVAQDANGNDLAERSDSARIDTDVTDTNFQVARSPDDPFRVTLSWDLHPPLARCSDRVFYEVKKDTPFQNLTGREDTRLIGDDRAGTQGSVQLDLSAGPGNYYFRLAGKSGGGGEEADVGRRGAGVPVPFPTTAPTVELAINGGLSITHQDLVDLVIGIPLPPGLPDAQTRWRASESESNLASQQWRGFASPTRFRLSEGDATKTVFVQVQHGAVGHNATTALQSPVESDSIVLSLARAPKIELNLDSGASSTTDRGVSLSHVLTDPGNGVPSSFRASEDADLTDVAWRPYETAPAFVLSEGNSGKRVFMQVRSVVGEGLAATNVESPIASDTIALVAAATVGVSNEQPAPPREVSVGVSAVTKLVDYSFTGGTQAGAGATASLSQYIRALQNAGIAVGNLECAIIQGQREIKLVDGTPRRQPGGFFSFLAPRPPELVSPGCMFRLGPLPNAAFDILVIDAEEDPNSSPVNFITVNRESDPPPRVELIHTDDVPGNVLLRRIVIRGPAGADWGDAFRP
jgi:hypothetical protein